MNLSAFNYRRTSFAKKLIYHYTHKCRKIEASNRNSSIHSFRFRSELLIFMPLKFFSVPMKIDSVAVIKHLHLGFNFLFSNRHVTVP